VAGPDHNTDMYLILDWVLTLNLIANTAIFYVAARLYLLPQLPRLRPQQILVPILLLHSMRHLGMMFLTRGATYPGLPSQFAYPAAFGDMITAIIAFVTIPIVLRGSRFARPAVWFFNIFGTSTYSWRSLSPPFTMHRSRWDLPIGFRLSGYHYCW
jgi:hypothetical protein